MFISADQQFIRRYILLIIPVEQKDYKDEDEEGCDDDDEGHEKIGLCKSN